MFAAVPESVKVEVAVNAENVAVPENAGELEYTTLPVPVSSVKADARFTLDGVESHVPTLLPSPVMPAIGRPVAFVSVRADGVPRFGVVKVGEVPKTSAPVPVSSPTIAMSSAEVSISAVEKLLVPNPSVLVATHTKPVPVLLSTMPFEPALFALS